jgi:glycolate oxidase
MADFAYSPVTPEVVEELRALLSPGQVTTDEEKRAAYSRDEVASCAWDRPYLAEVLVFPERTAQVSAVLRFADERRISVTPRGAGTGLSGGAVPVFGGIVLSLERMNAILEVDVDNLCITVEPGVVTSEITRAAAAAGLLYAGDPCSGDASFIGGNIAENAGGNKVIKYGSTGASVLGLEVVLADGSVTWFGGKRRKDVTGYDFVRLLVGSEGTLGVVTKAILKLVPLPERVVDLLVPFPDAASAVAVVPRIMREGGILPSSVEFMDALSVQLAERFLNRPVPHSDRAGAYLLIQIEGNDRDVLADDYERIGRFCLEHGALEVFVADNRTMRDRLWKVRKNLTEAAWAFFPPEYADEDIVVPTSAIPEFLDRLGEICARHGTVPQTMGHVGDGNLHATIFFSGGTPPDWKQRLAALQRELYPIVKALGGTLTGEHGVGLKRREDVSLFLDEAQMALIRRVKLAFDPNNILNPGKIVPWTSPP